MHTLGCFNGELPPAAEVATLVGMRSRFQLARALRQDGLPPLEELSAWARVLYWLFQAEGTGASLHRLARRTQLDAATAYRLVRRVTRLRWTELRQIGLAAAVQRLRARCHVKPGTGRARSQSSAPASHLGQHPPPEPASRRCPPARPGHPAGTLTPGLPVDGAPFDVAIDPDGTAYITCVRAARLERVALEPFRSVGCVSTGPVPTRIVFNGAGTLDRKSTRLNSSHMSISYAVFCLKKKKQTIHEARTRSEGVMRRTSAEFERATDYGFNEEDIERAKSLVGRDAPLTAREHLTSGTH